MSDGEFKKSFRGYSRAEVDARVKADGERLIALRAELNMAKAEMDKLKANEDSIKQTMLLAQHAKDEAIEQAHAEATRIVQDARQRSEEILKACNTQIEGLRWDLEKLHLDKQRFLDSYRKLLEDHLRDLSEATSGLSLVESQPKPVAPPAPAQPQATAPRPPMVLGEFAPIDPMEPHEPVEATDSIEPPDEAANL